MISDLSCFPQVMTLLGVGAVLKLWVAVPLGVKHPFHGDLISCISDLYIMIHNTNKINYEEVMKIILWLESPQHEELH